MESEKPARPDTAREYIPEILHEDNHVIAVNKPSGMLTQGDASGEVSLLEHLKQYVKKRDHKPGNVFLGMVQRLDKPVSGVVVFAKTSKGAKRISEQIRNRQVLKYYVAVTPSVGTRSSKEERDRDPGWSELRDQLLRVGSKTVVSKTPKKGTQSAVLQMKTVFRNDNYCLHLIRLITGRKHQIRAQLSARHMPISGDWKYGSQTKIEHGRILLHAYLVRLLHPTRKITLEINCQPLPEFMYVFDDTEQETILERLNADVFPNGPECFTGQ